MSLVLLVFAFCLFVLATTLFVPEPNRNRVISAGLACWVAASLFSQWVK
jgi:hypothetical protein